MEDAQLLAVIRRMIREERATARAGRDSTLYFPGVVTVGAVPGGSAQVKLDSETNALPMVNATGRHLDSGLRVYALLPPPHGAFVVAFIDEPTTPGGVWRRAAVQTLTTGVLATILWDTEVYDSHGFLTPTSGTVTIPTGMGGWYTITTQCTPNAGMGTVAYWRITTNGLLYHQGDPSGLRPAAGLTVYIAAGGTITAAVFQNSGGNVDVTCRLDLSRIGPLWT